ncbi:hypothetical protein FRC14_002345 [Serendipita sp. 396]|nr:hypothetical protein FRC14_002345 [Serendipita sp. 396]KAG8788632.1 hypothetical protein FRC15_003156 [Serendipita sp. 397]KAG8803930.1 hypothetical protein FRC16_002044 [Serendipita sp. 398]KAG8828081.1 hypothetical protein FRC19_009937 [Serendipita sp. 401]KAG8847072.1 hypothetical protein FRB91_000229 [Serendipita sp. 411]
MADLGSQLLGVRTPRKSPGTLSARRSNVSLRQSSSLAQDLGGADNDGGQRFTLAHELAAALMPDPNSSSRMLADEFGIELEDEDEAQPADSEQVVQVDTPIQVQVEKFEQAEQLPLEEVVSHRQSPVAAEPLELPSSRRRSPPSFFEKDHILVLNQSLKSTDLFINQLKKLDVEATQQPPVSHESSLEQLAGDIIRRIEESTRQREEQVRELMGFEREFRKIAGEIGGNDLLGDLDELECVEGLIDESSIPKDAGTQEEERTAPRHMRKVSTAWQDAPDPHSLDSLAEEEDEDYEYGYEEPTTPAKDATFLPPSPPSTGPPTPSSTLPHFAYMRTITQSLVSSLGTISEQTQVNNAATTEAGRKIRMLKNKLGGWKSEWESAERSRIRVERWEAGIWEEHVEVSLSSSRSSQEDATAGLSIQSPQTQNRRIDARKVVEEELRAFSLALQDAAIKTNAIMSTS